MKTLNIKQKIYSLLMKNGKKQTSEKLFLKSLKLLQKHSKIEDSLVILKTSIINNSQLTKIKIINRNKKRKNKHNISFPYLLTFNQKIFISLKTLINNSRTNKNSKQTFENLFIEILETCNKQSKHLEQINTHHNEAFLKKKFSHYRWF